MKQVVQQLDTGETSLVEAPSPLPVPGAVVIKTTMSLISSGTERMLVGFGKASMLQKARQQPEKVKQVLGKIRTDGLISTIDAVRSKLAQPLPLGYCNVGEVIATGEGVDNVRVGDRVVSNGPHADIVRVPQNLCAPIPDVVTDEAAAFTVVASIGLQGIRLLQPALGEAFTVTGAGLIGLLTIQLLRAHGCRVLAIDFDESKLVLARQFGAETCNPGNGEDPVAAGLAFSRRRGVDGVVITASTTSNDPVTQAARMCRKRGRIVLVGVTGLELDRADFYEKELSFQVSCSYGPGRYDPNYEERGQDYPFGFVRWTEKRNFEAVLDMMASGRLDTAPLISARYKFDNARDAYQALTNDRSGLGLLLEYESPLERRLVASAKVGEAARFDATRPIIGFVGAGNYASRILIPAFKQAGAQLHTLVTSGGLSSAINGRKAGFAVAASDVAAVLADEEVNTVVVATRHDSHATIAAQALRAGKNVWVEKPLALTVDEITEVESAYADAHARGSGPHLMVGYNRRFAPQVRKAKELLASVKEPKAILMVMNAGAIPRDHWTQSRTIGGGRIVGEACHFIDLMRFLVNSPIIAVSARRMGDSPGVDVAGDKVSITLGFGDGSFGTIMYLANGAASFPKERIEIFAAGRTLQLDNFRKLAGFGWPGFRKFNLMRQDKGQAAGVAAFLAGVLDGKPTIPADEIFEVARATAEVDRQIQNQ